MRSKQTPAAINTTRSLQANAAHSQGVSVCLQDVAKITGIEPNPAMFQHVRKRMQDLNIPEEKVDLVAGYLEHLPFDDGSFDAVVCTLVLCSVKSQEQALQEMVRVLKPGGAFLFVEHVAADTAGAKANMQSCFNPLNSCLGDGCQLIRDTGAKIAACGLQDVTLNRMHLKDWMLYLHPMIWGTGRKERAPT